jgi:hypothetical protein
VIFKEYDLLYESTIEVGLKVFWLPNSTGFSRYFICHKYRCQICHPLSKHLLCGSSADDQPTSLAAAVSRKLEMEKCLHVVLDCNS